MTKMAARNLRPFRSLEYSEPVGGSHLTGVSGVPLLELTQPGAVRLHGLGSL
jgi:hypothetical protein